MESHNRNELLDQLIELVKDRQAEHDPSRLNELAERITDGLATRGFGDAIRLIDLMRLEQNLSDGLTTVRGAIAALSRAVV